MRATFKTLIADASLLRFPGQGKRLLIPALHETPSRVVQAISTLPGEDTDSVPSGIQHIIAPSIGTELDGNAHAVTLRVIGHSHHFLELAVGGESLDARGGA